MQSSRAPGKPRDLDDQALSLHRALGQLVKRLQFRDRHEICCHGISVSGCYVLDALAGVGEMTMGEIAAAMHTGMSTMTRVVDQLEGKGLVARVLDRKDRRIWRVGITAAGGQIQGTITTEMVERERGILSSLPSSHRETVIAVIEELASAIGIDAQGGQAEKGVCCNVREPK